MWASSTYAHITRNTRGSQFKIYENLKYGREICERPIIGKYRFFNDKLRLENKNIYGIIYEIHSITKTENSYGRRRFGRKWNSPCEAPTLCGPRDSRVGPPAGTFKYLGGTQAPQ